MSSRTSTPSASVESTPQRPSMNGATRSPMVERPSRPSPQSPPEAESLYRMPIHTQPAATTGAARLTTSQPNSPAIGNRPNTAASTIASPFTSTAPPSTPLQSVPRVSSSFATQPRLSRPDQPIVTMGGGRLTGRDFNTSPESSTTGPRDSPVRSPPLASSALLSPNNFRPALTFSMPEVTLDQQKNTVTQASSTIHPRTLAYAQGSDEDEDEDEDDGVISQQQQPTRLFSSVHAQPPFHIDQVTNRPVGVVDTTAAASPTRFSFTNNPSATSSPAGSAFPPFSPSELMSPAGPGASVIGNASADKAPSSGFSPSHAHWNPSNAYDEVYEVEPSPASSPKLPPRSTNNNSIEPSVTPSPPSRICMSPATKSAAKSIVPSIGWLLILNRKLQQSGAITDSQSRALKTKILAGKPELLSAVDRFVKKENQQVIIQALMACLPEASVNGSEANASEEEEEEQEEEEDDDEDGDAANATPSDDSDSDKDYRAILGSGRGEGGHKAKGVSPYKDASKSAVRFGIDDDEDEDDDDEEENPLIILNSLLPLSLPQVESLHSLLRQLGFHLLDVETLNLCTSRLLTPTSSTSSTLNVNGRSNGVRPVSLADWTLCVKELRLHSSDPKLLTQVLLDIFRILDLRKDGHVGYGELIATIAALCLASGKNQRLKAIYQALALAHTSKSNNDVGMNGRISTAPPSPAGPSEQVIPATTMYGFLFAFSLTMHVLLHRSAGESGDVAQSVHPGSSRVSNLTNSLYALMDDQLIHQLAEEEENEEEPALSYNQIMAWKYSPVFVIETLLDRADSA